MPKDIKEWVRKHETKLQVNQVGVEKKNVNVTKGSGHYMLNEDETDLEDEEIFALETAIRDLQDGEPQVIFRELKKMKGTSWKSTRPWKS